MTKSKHKRDIPNEAFPQLSDDTSIWRYTDLPKFIWSISKKKLWLSRSDLLGDQFEGSVPRRNHEVLIEKLIDSHAERLGSKEKARKHVIDELIPRFISARRLVMLTAEVCCWSAASESEAMWRLYCGKNDGLAFVTTFGKLKESLTDAATRLAAVRYIDYNRDLLPSDNLLQAITHKRSGFEHEKEVRIVRWLSDDIHNIQVSEDLKPQNLKLGRAMGWDPEMSIDRIVVSPYAPQWYLETVQEILEKFAPSLAKYTSWSELRGDPQF